MDTFESIMKPIDSSAVKNASQILMKYRAGKRRLESKIVENEEFWKLRQWGSGEKGEKRTPATAWLWNVLVSKHADAMDSIPEPNILPREENDVAQAKLLSGVIPVILEQNDFSTTYSDAMWYKLKQGTGVYGVFWDSGTVSAIFPLKKWICSRASGSRESRIFSRVRISLRHSFSQTNR